MQNVKGTKRIAVAGFFAGILILGGCGQQPGAPPQMGPPEVAVVTIQPQRVLVTTELAGRTSPHRVAEVHEEGGVGDGGHHQRGVPEGDVEAEECAGSEGHDGRAAKPAAARVDHGGDHGEGEEEAPEGGSLWAEVGEAQADGSEADGDGAAEHHGGADPRWGGRGDG